MTKLLGIQDFPMSAPRWLDSATSVTWLRTWEKLVGTYELHALLREPYISYSMQSSIRGVYYHFEQQDTFWKNLLANVLKIGPSYIFYNCFEYKKMADFIQIYHNHDPSCLHIVRSHHELARVVPLIDLDSVNVADIWIVASASDASYLNLAKHQPCKLYTVPFGVDVDYFSSHQSEEKRSIDFVTSTSTNPVKQSALINQVFTFLNAKGYTTQNVVGASKDAYRKVLQSARVYVTLSTSEASGSRSLLEAMAADAYPVIWSDCKSAYEIICQLEYGEHVVGTAEEIADQLENILKELNEPLLPVTALQPYTETAEIDALYAIFKSLREIDQQIHRHITVHSRMRQMLLWFNNLLNHTTEFSLDLLRVIPNIPVDSIPNLWKTFHLKPNYMAGFTEKLSKNPNCFVSEMRWILEH